MERSQITITISREFAVLVIIVLVLVTISQSERILEACRLFKESQVNLMRPVMAGLSGLGWIGLTLYFSKLVWNAWRGKNHR